MMIFWSVFFGIIFAVLALRAGFQMWQRLSDKTAGEIVLAVIVLGVKVVFIAGALVYVVLAIFAVTHTPLRY